MHFYTCEKKLDTDNTQFSLTIITSLGSLPSFPEVIMITNCYAFNAYLSSHRKQITVSSCQFFVDYLFTQIV